MAAAASRGGSEVNSCGEGSQSGDGAQRCPTERTKPEEGALVAGLGLGLFLDLSRKPKAIRRKGMDSPSSGEKGNALI